MCWLGEQCRLTADIDLHLVQVCDPNHSSEINETSLLQVNMPWPSYSVLVCVFFFLSDKYVKNRKLSCPVFIWSIILFT